MNLTEEMIEATLDPNGRLRLTHPPTLTPGPVRVTIRVAALVVYRRGLADVIREIAAEQRLRGFPGRSAADLRDEEDEHQAEDAERNRELDTARPLKEVMDDIGQQAEACGLTPAILDSLLRDE